MKRPSAIAACSAAAVGLFLITIVVPTVGSLHYLLSQEGAPAGGFTFTGRQAALLWRSVWMAGAASALCVAAALPFARLLARSRTIAVPPLAGLVMLGVLLCPPMVYSFGWERVLPASVGPGLRCIGIWALWAWPIPAMVLASGWAASGRRAYEAAILTTGPRQATLRIVLPALGRHVALALLLLFLLFFNDYGVPHACGLVVYATELLSWATSSSRVIDSVWPALPGVLITLSLLAAAWRVSAVLVATDHDSTRGAPLERRRSDSVVVTAYALVAFAIPIGALAASMSAPWALFDAVTTYARDLGWSLGVALLSGTLIVAMAAGIAGNRRLRIVATGWAVVLGALPGGVVGAMLICVFARPLFAAIYDQWPILVVCNVARFGWLGMSAITLLAPRTADPLAAQAQTDGASGPAIALRIHLPRHGMSLLGVAVSATALALAEVPATSLVRPPAFSPIALLVIEKFHRFETDMLVSLSLWLVASAVPATVVVLAALRRRTSAIRIPG